MASPGLTITTATAAIGPPIVAATVAVSGTDAPLPGVVWTIDVNVNGEGPITYSITKPLSPKQQWTTAQMAYWLGEAVNGDDRIGVGVDDETGAVISFYPREGYSTSIALTAALPAPGV